MPLGDQDHHARPFADTALKYFHLGWHPLYLPARRKKPVPPDTTGRRGIDLTETKIKLAIKQHPDGNIAIRMPEGVIGIDVDTYGEKQGALQLLDFQLAHGLGDLLPTYRSSARDPRISSIRFYRVPPAIKFPAQLPGCDNIETIRREHRYAVVAPSVHPDTGDVYRWYSPDGTTSEPPAIAALAELPPEWVEAIAPRPSEPPQPPPADAIMTPEESAQVRAMLTTRLTALADDPAAAWDNSSYALACDLVRLSNANPTAYPLEQARRDYLEYAPEDSGFTGARRNGKIDSAIDMVGADARKPSVLSDFTPLPPSTDDGFLDLKDYPIARHISKRVMRDVRPLRSGAYAVWRGTHWEVSKANSRDLKAAVAAALDEVSKTERKKLTQLLDKRARAARTTEVDALSSDNKITHVCNILEALHQVDDTEFDGPETEYLLSCGNGVLDIRTGELSKPRQEQFISRHTSVEYDPTARHDDWDKALSLIPATTWQWLRPRLGQALIGRQPSDNKLLVLTGGGSNGKSTIVATIRRVLGSYGLTAKHEIFTKQSGPAPSLMRLRGVRYALVEELPDRVNPDSLKALTSYGTEIVGRGMYKDEIAWQGSHTIIVTANRLPRIAASDYGAWRRLVNIHFDRNFKPGSEKPDVDLIDRLVLPDRQRAVLAWLVAAAREYLADPATAMIIPESEMAATESWRRQDSSAIAFIEAYLEPGGHDDAMMSSTIYAMYNASDPAGTRRAARTINEELRQAATDSGRLPNLQLSERVYAESVHWAEDGTLILPTRGQLRAARGVRLSAEGRMLLERLRDRKMI